MYLEFNGKWYSFQSKWHEQHLFAANPQMYLRNSVTLCAIRHWLHCYVVSNLKLYSVHVLCSFILSFDQILAHYRCFRNLFVTWKKKRENISALIENSIKTSKFRKINFVYSNYMQSIISLIYSISDNRITFQQQWIQLQKLQTVINNIWIYIFTVQLYTHRNVLLKQKEFSSWNNPFEANGFPFEVNGLFFWSKNKFLFKWKENCF